MTGSNLRIWGLLGSRTGDNNQVLALAEALGVPFETRTLRYNLLRALHANILGERLISLTRETRRWIAPPWPDMVIAIGRRSVPVARWIKRASGGRTKLVLLGNPRVDPGLFDLVITTRQYPVPPGDNVLLLPLSMSRFNRLPEPEPDEQEQLTPLPRPHLLMAVGGATKYWTLDAGNIADALQHVCERADRLGGSVIAVGSPRTDAAVIDSLRSGLTGRSNGLFVEGKRPRFPLLLSDADEIFVTGDSISMLSEAILAGKPVGLIPIEESGKGRRKLGPEPAVAGSNARRRDLRRFWNHLRESGLVGTIEQPQAGFSENPAVAAAAAVHRLLAELA